MIIVITYLRSLSCKIIYHDSWRKIKLCINCMACVYFQVSHYYTKPDYLSQFSAGIHPNPFTFTVLTNTLVNPVFRETSFLLTLPLFLNVTKVFCVSNSIIVLNSFQLRFFGLIYQYLSDLDCMLTGKMPHLKSVFYDSFGSYERSIVCFDQKANYIHKNSIFYSII